MRTALFYWRGETAIRKRLATGRPTLNAGMNFHVNGVFMRFGSLTFVFSEGSAVRALTRHRKFASAFSF